MREHRGVGEQVRIRELKEFACLDSRQEGKDPEVLWGVMLRSLDFTHCWTLSNLVELALGRNHFGNSFGKRMGGRLVRSCFPSKGSFNKVRTKGAASSRR